MANGDAAVAAGMDVVAGTADRRMGYDEINKTRDYIAARTSTVTPITKGGTGATTASAARTALSVPSITDMANGDKKLVDGTAQLYWNGSDRFNSTGGFGAAGIIATNTNISAGGTITAGGNIVSSTYLGSGGSIVATSSITGGDFNSTTGYNRNVSGGGVRAAYFASDGRLGTTTSSLRYKRILEAIEADPLAILELAPQFYQYKWAYEELGEDAYVEAGLIAEDLHEAGLEWLVYYDDQNRPDGIHYDRVALAVLLALQYVWEQHKALDARVTALEGN